MRYNNLTNELLAKREYETIFLNASKYLYLSSSVVKVALNKGRLELFRSKICWRWNEKRFVKWMAKGKLGYIYNNQCLYKSSKWAWKMLKLWPMGSLDEEVKMKNLIIDYSDLNNNKKLSEIKDSVYRYRINDTALIEY